MVTLAAGTGRAKRNPLLGSRAPWINTSDATWVAGHRAGAPIVCAVAAIVTLLSLVVVVLRGEGGDVDGGALVTAILMPCGVGAAAVVAGAGSILGTRVQFEIFAREILGPGSRQLEDVLLEAALEIVEPHERGQLLQVPWADGLCADPAAVLWRPDAAAVALR